MLRRSCTTCCLFPQRLVTCARRRVRRRRHVHRRRAMPLRDQRSNELPHVRRRYAPLPHVQRHRCAPLPHVHRRRRVLHKKHVRRHHRRGHSCCDRPLHHPHRDSCLRRRLQTDAHPSRGHNPSRPMGPCPGRSRYRNILARNSHRASRHTAHSHSSHTGKSVEPRCRQQSAPEPPAPGPSPRTMLQNR